MNNNYTLSASSLKNSRENNEDTFVCIINDEVHIDTLDTQCIDMEKDKIICAVFDGMGGMDYGKAASLNAANYLKDHYNELDMNNLETINPFIQAMNLSVLKELREKSGNGGTTMALLMFQDNKYMMINVGDSPIFKINTDTYEEAITELSVMDNIAAMRYKNNIEVSLNNYSELLSAIGIQHNVAATHIRTGSLREKDKFIIQSDGFKLYTYDVMEMIFNEDLLDATKLNELSAHDDDNSTLICISSN